MKFFASFSLAAGLAFSGPNQNAILSVDLIPGSAASDSTLSMSKDNGAFWVAVRIAQAVGLDSYGFELGFDSTLLTFVQAAPSSIPDGLPNFLESRSGITLGFLGQLSSRDSTKVNIAHSLVGSDSVQSPSGSGIVALLRFQPRGIPGDALFSLGAIQLLDWRLQLDTAMAAAGARLTLNTTVTIWRGGDRRNPRLAALFPAGALFLGSRDLLGRAVFRPALR